MHAYRQGIFPMADDDGSVGWYSPDPRAIIPLDTFHVPQTLAKTVRQGKFTITVDQSFEEVMRACGDRETTWMTEEFIQAYASLHKLGMAHSVEARQCGKLVGGLYGVALGGAFMGESMFSRVRDASKVSLVYLVERLKKQGFTLLDSQYPTEHLMRFGMAMIPRQEYLKRLTEALALEVTFV